MSTEHDTAGLHGKSGGVLVDRGQSSSHGLSFRRELGRKSIHAATVLLPLAVWMLPRPAAVGLLLFGAGAAVATEAARRHVRWVRYAFLRRTRRLLRAHERRRPAGATYMALAYLIAFVVFPKEVAVAAMLYNGLGDAVAAVVGRRWGRHRLPSGKSWEGFAAGAGVSVGVGFLIPGIAPAAAVVGGVSAALLEIGPARLDDNLVVTIGGGAALWAAVALLG